MKPTPAIRKFLLGSTLMVASLPSAQAADYWWNQNGVTSGWGGSGTWDTTSAVFSTTNSDTVTAAAATTETVDTLYIGTSSLGFTGGTITVSGTQNIGSIITGSANSTENTAITGGTALNFAATGTITNNTSRGLIIGSKITGAGTALDLYANSTGVITLSTASTSSFGVLNIRTGRIHVNNPGGFGGTGAGKNTVIFDGATLSLNGSSTFTEAMTISGSGYGSNAGALVTGNSTGQAPTLSGAITLGADARIGVTTGTAANSLTLSGGITLGGYTLTLNPSGANTTTTVQTIKITGNGNLIKSGAGTLNLNVGNDFVGGTTVEAGTLNLGSATALGNTSNSLTINGGAVAITAGINYTIGNLSGASGTTLTGGASTTNLTIGTGNATGGNYAGVIATGGGTFSLIKNGSGTIELSGANTYTGGTTVNSGTLILSGNRSSTNSTAVTIAPADSGGATLSQSAGTITAGGNAHLIGTTSNGAAIYNLSGGTLSTVFSSSMTRGVLLGPAANSNATFNLSGTGNLNMSTAALVVGRNDNTAATGSTVVFNQTGGTASVGNLSIGGSNAYATNNANITATLNLSAGTFTATNFNDLAGGNGSISTINISGTADVTLPAFPQSGLGSGSTATITFDGGVLKNSGTSTNYLGVITSAQIKDGGAKFNTTGGDITITHALDNFSGHTGSLTKEGSNTLTLSGTNTYTGATTVSAGTLLIDGNNSAATGAVNVASGLTAATAVRLKGTGTVGGATTFAADPDGSGNQVGGIHSPGASVGKQSFVSDLTYNSGSIFEWELGTTLKDSTTGARETDYDAVNVGGNLQYGGGTGDTDKAIFRIILAGTQDFTSDSFWSTSHTWTDIFTNLAGSSAKAFGDIFSSLEYYNSNGEIAGPTGGYSFTVIDGSTLSYNFTAIPEPTTALAGLLLTVGLMRRRRCNESETSVLRDRSASISTQPSARPKP